MKNLLVLLFLLTANLYSNKLNVKNTSLQGAKPDKFFEIRYENLLKNKQIIGLSQLALNVEYIPLETNDDCIIGRGKYFFTDSLLFVSNRDHILKFSRNGKFLRKIGSPGRGPGEIDIIRTMSIIPDKRLIVIQKNSENKLLFFSFDGKLIKTINIPYTWMIKVMNDEKYIAYDSGSAGSEKYTFRLTNEHGDTISVVNNYTTWDYVRHLTVVHPAFEPFYFYRNNFFFKAMYNDTVYTLNSNKIVPNYFINLGKFKLPDELRPERININDIKIYTDNRIKYYFANVFEAANMIFLASYCYGIADPMYLLFDRDKQNGNLLVNKSGTSTGFINDWDGGMDFWPTGSISNDQVFMVIDILAFQGVLEDKELSQKLIKFPEKQRQLENMISKLDVTNNPIIMVVTINRK